MVIGALTDAELKKAGEALRAAGREPAGYVGNLSQPGEADKLLAAAVEAYGGVDILVNNAGGGVIRATLEHTEETLRATVDNNLWTTIYCTRALLPHLVARGGGRIVNIGAESVRNGLVDHAIYNAAKGGVHAMCSALAREFAPAGITVNAVGPVLRETPEIRAAVGRRHVRRRLPERAGPRHDPDPAGPPGHRRGRGRRGRLPGRPGRRVRHRPGDQRQRRQQHGLAAGRGLTKYLYDTQ